MLYGMINALNRESLSILCAFSRYSPYVTCLLIDEAFRKMIWISRPSIPITLCIQHIIFFVVNHDAIRHQWMLFFVLTKIQQPSGSWEILILAFSLRKLCLSVFPTHDQNHPFQNRMYFPMFFRPYILAYLTSPETGFSFDRRLYFQAYFLRSV